MLKPFDIQHRYVYNFLKFIIFSAHHWQIASKNLLSIDEFVWCILFFKNEEKVAQNCLVIMTLLVYAMSAKETWK